MHILFNALAASSGSGLTYVRNIAPVIARRSDLRATFLVGSELVREMPPSPNVAFQTVKAPVHASKRFLWEQWNVPKFARQLQADVLISTGNIAVHRSPVPQILLSGNSLYTSGDYRKDLMKRGEYRMLMDHRVRSWVAVRSLHWADTTVTPSRAFATELAQRVPAARIVDINHGFDEQVFFGDTLLPPEIEEVLTKTSNSLRLLFVSHYNYFRNFETLLRGFSLIRAMIPERDPKLFLTTRLISSENPGEFRAESAAKLVKDLGLSEHVVELGTVPYRQLHHLYKSCHVYVTPAYAETFAHPVVEAMACGLPVVASDLPVHQEVAGDAAAYFPKFSAEGLAQRVRDVVSAPAMAERMSRDGKVRALSFSWLRHVEQLSGLAESVLRQRSHQRE